jgi:hypothetical protein
MVKDEKGAITAWLMCSSFRKLCDKSDSIKEPSYIIIIIYSSITVLSTIGLVSS